MWLNCKVIKKWQPSISTSTSLLFRFTPLSIKKFCTPPPLLVTQFLEGPAPPPFNKGWEGGWGVGVGPTMSLFEYDTTLISLWEKSYIVLLFNQFITKTFLWTNTSIGCVTTRSEGKCMEFKTWFVTRITKFYE